MSRIIRDCLVAGDVVDGLDIGTSETAQCWPRPDTAALPMEYMRGRVRGKFCDKRGERVVAGDCKVHHA